ncbi:retrovirus-related pol polyprotein from transposon TNT 1-94 [Tanacetum coccineum]
MIAPRVRDVYVLDMTSSAQESSFFAKAYENLNWLWHKRLAHLNFKTINILAKQNLIIALPSLLPDEYLHPYESPEPVVLGTEVSSDPNGQGDQNDQSAQTDEILSSPNVEETFVQDTIPIHNPSISIPPMTSLGPQDKWSQDKHIELVNIIGDPRAGMLTRAMARELSDASDHECLFVDFLSKEEPKKVSEALKHPGWVDVMQDELNQFNRNKVWTLVPAPYAQGYNQQEDIDYDETFALVARLKAIRIFLAFSTYMNFIVYQMDVKSAFLNGKQKEEVYVKQPPGFESSEFPNHIKQSERGILINQEKYVKDLLKKYDINGSSVKTPMVPPDNLGPDLNGKTINETQYRGMIGSLMYLTASRPDIQFSTCLCARYQANPKESHLIDVKRIFRCLKSTPSLGPWYPKCSGKQSGDLVEMPSEAVEHGMDDHVPDEIDGAKYEQLPNHVVKKCNLEFIVCKQVANHGGDELVDKGRPLKRKRVYAE